MNIGNIHTLEAIAVFLGREVKGNSTAFVTGINDPRVAGNTDLTYVSEDVKVSAFQFVLASQELELTADQGQIISPDPFSDFNKLTKKFSPYQPQMSLTGEDCNISDSAHLAPNCFIGHRVTIGEYVTIHPGAYIGDDTVIEDRVIVGPGSVIGHYAFEYTKRDELLERQHSCGFVVLQEDVEVGALCTIDAGVSAITTVGKGTKINNQTYIGNEVHIGANCMISAQSNIKAFSNVAANSIV